MSDTGYRVVRFYFDRPGFRRTIVDRCTLAEAQAHCHDPDTRHVDMTRPSDPDTIPPNHVRSLRTVRPSGRPLPVWVRSWSVRLLVRRAVPQGGRHAQGGRVRAGGCAMTRKPLPAYLRLYWSGRVDDPRDRPHYCARQARKTPAIPWHNGYPVCLSCGKATTP